jgi:hypothetical protein
MATANFNTPIVSSDSNGGIRSYSLDNVINKDFEGPYDYNFNTAVPDGISIQITDKFGYILVISPNIEFELSIVVTQSGVADADFAIATTMITIEKTPVANFNTEILSSNSNEQAVSDSDNREYVLDRVINKDFEGPYKYNFLRSTKEIIGIPENGFVGVEFPKGLEIIENVEGQQVLSVGPNIEFELSIIVEGRDEKRAIATTMITIEGKPNFSKEITKLLNNQTLQEKFSNTKNDWAKIINRGTNEKVDDGIIYPGDDLVKPL